MVYDPVRQYQIKAEPPPFLAANALIQFYESTWHQPWSEPVRFRTAPRLTTALAASGPFAPVLDPKTLITQFFESRWHQPWSEPVRLPPRLRTGINLFNSLPFPIVPTPSNQLQGWFQEFRGPVWPKKGLRRNYQQPYTAPIRYLPPSNITVTMAATEINTDHAIFGIDVYTSPPVPIDLTDAKVSIEEIQATRGGNVSMNEIDP